MPLDLSTTDTQINCLCLSFVHQSIFVVSHAVQNPPVPSTSSSGIHVWLQSPFLRRLEFTSHQMVMSKAILWNSLEKRLELKHLALIKDKELPQVTPTVARTCEK